MKAYDFSSTQMHPMAWVARQADNPVPVWLRQRKTSHGMSCGEIKFAAREKKGRGVNVLFYQSRAEAERLHQQSLKFEVVSVPPPPELLQQMQEGELDGPYVDFVLSSFERSRIQGILRRAASIRPEGDWVRSIVREDWFKRVLLWRIGPSETEPHEQYLVLYATRAKKTGIWVLTVIDPPAVQTVLQYDDTPGFGARPQILRDFITSLSNAQQAMLEDSDE